MFVEVDEKLNGKRGDDKEILKARSNELSPYFTPRSEFTVPSIFISSEISTNMGKEKEQKKIFSNFDNGGKKEEKADTMYGESMFKEKVRISKNKKNVYINESMSNYGSVEKRTNKPISDSFQKKLLAEKVKRIQSKIVNEVKKVLNSKKKELVLEAKVEKKNCGESDYGKKSQEAFIGEDQKEAGKRGEKN